MTRGPSIAEIKQLLVERLDDLVHQLVPGAKLQGDHWAAKSPLRQGDDPTSFVVWRRGAPGAWKDYPADWKGDVLDLIACCACGGVPPLPRETRVAAIGWAKDFLGIDRLDPAKLRALRDKAETRRKLAEKGEFEARLRKRRRAFDLWLAGKPIFGTPVEAYLRGRGIDVGAIDHWDDGLRFLPRLDYWASSGEAPHVGPAMIAAFRHAQFGFTGLHATWLTPDGRKADVATPKKMLGQVAGSALRLTCGSAGEPLDQAEAPDALLLGEGIETVLSIAAEVPALRCWAVGSLGNFLQPDHPMIRAFLVAGDDDTNATATAGFSRAMAGLQAHGKPVLRVPLFGGAGDFNDLLVMGERPSSSRAASTAMREARSASSPQQGKDFAA